MSNFYQTLESSFAANLSGDALRLADGTVWRYQRLHERVAEVARCASGGRACSQLTGWSYR